MLGELELSFSGPTLYFGQILSFDKTAFLSFSGGKVFCRERSQDLASGICFLFDNLEGTTVLAHWPLKQNLSRDYKVCIYSLHMLSCFLIHHYPAVYAWVHSRAIPMFWFF